MAINVGDLISTLGLDDRDFKRGIKDASVQQRALGRALDKGWNVIKRAAQVAFAAISAAAVKAVVDAAKFETQLANIASLVVGDAKPTIDAFSDSILELAEALGENTDALSVAAYDIYSAGVTDAADATMVLEQAAVAAKAGLTDTGVAADALTTLLNAYGLEANRVTDVSDVLFETVRQGKTTFDRLAPSIGNVASIAATAGVPLEEVGNFLAIMTANGIDTEIAITNLRAIISSMLKPSDDAAKAAEELGINFSVAGIQTEGFANIIAQVSQLAPEMQARLFPNIRALSGVAAAGGDAAANLEKFVEQMEGATSSAFQKQVDTFNFAWNQFKATLQTTSITVGQQLLPQIREVVRLLTTWIQENRQNFVTFMQGFVQTVTNVVNLIVRWKDLLIGLGVAISTVVVGLKAAQLAMALFNTTMTIGAGPIGLIVAGITALVAVLLKVRAAAKRQQEEQELMTGALEGTLETTEEYDEALAALNDERQRELDMLEERLSSVDLTEQQKEEFRNNDAAIKQTDQRIAQVQHMRQWRINAAAQRKKDEEDQIARDQEAFLQRQQNQQQELNAEAERAQAARQRQAEIDAVNNALAEAAITDEQRIAAETARLEGLGFTTEKILEFLKLKYADFYAEVKEGSEDSNEEIIVNLEGRAEEEKALLDDLALFNETLDDEQLIRISRRLDAQRAAAEEAAEAEKKAADEAARAWEQAYNTIVNTVSAAMSSIQGVVGALFDFQESELENLGLSEEDLAKKKYDLQVGQFNANKAFAIADIAINTANAIMRAFASLDPISATIFSSIIGALGATQAGLVLAQQPPPPPKFARGGMVSGASGVDQVNANLSAGEFVVNRQATAMNRELLESINSGTNVSMQAAPVVIELDGQAIGRGMVEFMEQASDDGTVRINPKAIRSDT